MVYPCLDYLKNMVIIDHLRVIWGRSFESFKLYVLGPFRVIWGHLVNNIPAGHPPQHASNGIGGGLSPHFAGSLQPRHSVKHASVVSEFFLSFFDKTQLSSVL